jgi:ABC-type sugar transport system ATPase subunit
MTFTTRLRPRYDAPRKHQLPSTIHQGGPRRRLTPIVDDEFIQVTRETLEDLQPYAGIALSNLLQEAAGAEVILGVRPEHVAVRTEGEGMPAVMDIDEPMGSDSLLWLTLAGNPLRARASADHGFRHGQSVRVVFDIQRASLFDVTSEQRL